MNIYIYSGEFFGTNYFRAQLVRKYLERRGHAVVHSQHIMPEHSAGFDVIYILRPLWEYCSLEVIHKLKRAGVPIVMDYDDRLDSIPPWSPSAQFYQPWVKKDYHEHVFASADFITCGGPESQKDIKRWSSAPSMVINNAFDTEYKLLRPTNTFVRGVPTIGWVGGGQHQEDLESISDVWNECLNRGYHLEFLGDAPRCIVGKPNTNLTMGTQHVEMYFQIPPLLGFDVMLAPLLDIPFNRCKTDLKAMEYAWLTGCPMVLQDGIPTFVNWQEDGKRVFKASGNNWMEKIELAVEAMKTGGRKYWLPPGYSMEDTAPKWEEAMETAYRIVRGAEPPGPKIGNGRPAVLVGAQRKTEGLVTIGL